MAAKEARARIKINRLLEDAGWRFFANDAGPANIALEPNVKLTQNAVDELGENFEQTRNGFIDFLMNIIPGTIVGAFANGDILQVLLISLLCVLRYSSNGI